MSANQFVHVPSPQSSFSTLYPKTAGAVLAIPDSVHERRRGRKHCGIRNKFSKILLFALTESLLVSKQSSVKCREKEELEIYM